MVGSSCWVLLLAGCLLQAEEQKGSAPSSPLGSQPVLAAAIDETAPPPAEPRPVAELWAAIRDAMRESARTNQPDYEAVAPKLIDLFHEVDSHPDLPRAEKRTLRASLKSRLEQIEDILRRRLVRAEADAKRAKNTKTPQGGAAGEASNAADSERPANVNPPGVTLLAQQGNAAAGAGGLGGSNPGVIDRGWQLVDLIQRTIAPDTWDVNGGKGSAYYYRPLNVLVIRQTQAVHGEIGDVMQQLRRAGQ